MTNLSQTLGIAIKLARKRAGLTQQQLADLAEMKRPDITAIESGKRNLSVSLIERLAAALGLEAEIILKKLSNS